MVRARVPLVVIGAVVEDALDQAHARAVLQRALGRAEALAVARQAGGQAPGSRAVAALALPTALADELVPGSGHHPVAAASKVRFPFALGLEWSLQWRLVEVRSLLGLQRGLGLSPDRPLRSVVVL